MKCYNCGEELDKNDKICPYCSFRVEDAAKFQKKSQNHVTETPKKKKKVSKRKEFSICKWFKNLKGYPKSITIAFLVTLGLLIITIVFGQLLPYLESTADDKPRYVKWEQILLSDECPHFDSKKAKVLCNTDVSLQLNYQDMRQDDFYALINECIAKGYDLESAREHNTYKAFSKSGYSISINYNDSMDIAKLQLNAPISAKDLQWQLSDKCSMLPKPKSTKGLVEKDNSTKLSVYICDMNQENFNDYVAKCVDKGFDTDKCKTESVFSAKNTSNYKLTVTYVGNNTIYIELVPPLSLSEPTFPSENSDNSPKTETQPREETIETTAAIVIVENGGVYITPTGTKYHLDKNCAGVNAQAVSLESAQQKYSPCKKCAQ